MAEARHGMCELTRHGMAGERNGFCELAFTQIKILGKFVNYQSTRRNVLQHLNLQQLLCGYIVFGKRVLRKMPGTRTDEVMIGGQVVDRVRFLISLKIYLPPRYDQQLFV
jgi:hypothetical protein